MVTENPTPQKGDRVRVTTVVEGLVEDVGSKGAICVYIEGGAGSWHLTSEPFAGTRTIEVLTPAEPPDGSVLLDRYGLAWQRRGGGWYSVEDDCFAWADLQYRGPFNVIHRGGDDAD